MMFILKARILLKFFLVFGLILEVVVSAVAAPGNVPVAHKNVPVSTRNAPALKPDPDKVVLVSFLGGFGNQIFAYAIAKSYAWKHGKQLYLDAPTQKFLKLFKITDPVVSEKDDFVFPRLSTEKKKGLSKFSSSHVSLEVMQDPTIAHFSSYLQSAAPLELYEKELQKTLTFHVPFPKKTRVLIKKAEKENSVAVHLRRGDYLHFFHHHVLPMSYYQKAMAEMRRRLKNPVFYFFSDDMDFVKKTFADLKDPHVFVDWHQKDTEDLALMSRMKHQIIANSTFSWWGAFLNPNPDKIVLTPSRWLTYDDEWAAWVTPKKWHVIDAEHHPALGFVMSIDSSEDFSLVSSKAHFLFDKYGENIEILAINASDPTFNTFDFLRHQVHPYGFLHYVDEAEKNKMEKVRQLAHAKILLFLKKNEIPRPERLPLLIAWAQFSGQRELSCDSFFCFSLPQSEAIQKVDVYHDGWIERKDQFSVRGNRITRLSTGEKAIIVLQKPDQVTIVWDDWGEEDFKIESQNVWRFEKKKESSFE